MLRIRSFAPALLLPLLASSTATAQTAADSNEGLRMIKGSTSGTMEVRWFGHAGRSYFLEHSPLLETGAWSYLPFVEKGVDTVIAYGMSEPVPGGRSFVRLRYWEGGSTHPKYEDFDGDGVLNMDELQAGLDPFNASDSDADGMKDDWERFYFGTLARTGGGDYDGDGVSDLDEFTAHRRPNTSIQYGTLKFTYFGENLAGTVVYMTDFNEENSLSVTYTDATRTRVQSILIHTGVSRARMSHPESFTGGVIPVAATYTLGSDTDGAHTLTFESHTVAFDDDGGYGLRAFTGLDLLRKIDDMPYQRAVVSDVVHRICKYTAITSKSVGVIAPTLFTALIRDFPYKSPEFIDFGRIVNISGDTGSFVQSQLGADGLPLSTLTDADLTRKIYSADSFGQWYRQPDTLSININKTHVGDFYTNGFGLSNEFPFTLLTSSAGGYQNHFCWTSEVHVRLAYDISGASLNPTKIRVQSDDDIWVFLNNKLIISRAGIPAGEEEITLRGIDHGLTEEISTADVTIFHAERREGAAAVYFQSNSPVTPVYVYQVIADTRFSTALPHFTLSSGAPAGMTINEGTGKILWDYSGAAVGAYIFTVNVNATGDNLNKDSQTVNILLGEKPAFTTVPEPSEVLLGEDVTLTAVATGYPEPTYQWYLNSVAIPGAASSTYTIADATYDDDGEYTVRATNAVAFIEASAYVFVYGL